MEQEQTYHFNIQIAGSIFGYNVKEFKTTEEKMILFASEIFNRVIKDEVHRDTSKTDFISNLINDCFPRQTKVEVFNSNNELVVAYMGK